MTSNIGKNSKEITALNEVIEKFAGIEDKMEKQEKIITDLSNENESLKEKLLNMEYHSRRDNLQFVGYDKIKKENPEKMVRDTLSKAGIEI